MSELWQCGICKSIIAREQIDGQCKTCKNNTCIHCKRICDRCQEICCMLHTEAKIIMRNQQPYVHRLCWICKQIWV